ncbi:hypothetical protein DIC66_18755 [Rhodoferax lacus]|uniref:Outer membrane protein beta-barrel domain-containing protein n=1 Tax=Rhodoferax lacus TaxID=2184758 RepID=A0A3E1R871_9BURK|nr:hypothetical protein [Rhodoferax lacus]RFO95401.1 hypothetical protein DIC66_18755 [Rhodoferax lacus]
MKKQLALLAALAAISTGLHAQDSYVGVGLPGLLTLGYAYPLTSSVGLRGEYAGGLSVNKDGNQDGVNVTGTFKASRMGAFADWFPMGGAFRLVGGLTFNDIKADFNGVGSGTSTINGQTVNMSGETYNVKVKFPDTTAYLGVGYGHQKSDAKGLGFYADLGVMVGSFTADTSTSLVANGKVLQSDVDAQNQKIRDSLSSLSVLPSASLGLLYRY